MIIGTAYFVSIYDANNYYKDYESDDLVEFVNEKIRNKEIFIGRPKTNHNYWPNQEGRYMMKVE